MQKSSKKSRKGLLSGSLALDPVFEGSRNMGLRFQIVSDTFSGKDTSRIISVVRGRLGPALFAGPNLPEKSPDAQIS